MSYCDDGSLLLFLQPAHPCSWHESYVPILAIGGIGFGFTAFPVLAATMAGRSDTTALRRKRRMSANSTFASRSRWWTLQSVFLTAMLFIIFDIEVFSAWAVSFQSN
jgi:NADH-quinone oxidoreductase subunit A